jgi:hypothetical protein
VTREQALVKIESKGLSATAAQTSLDAAFVIAETSDVDELLASAGEMNTTQLREVFGQEGVPAVFSLLGFDDPKARIEARKRELLGT